MNKAVLIVLLAVIGLVASQENPNPCAVSAQCAGLNGACGSLFASGSSFQTSTAACNYGLYCSYTTATLLSGFPNGTCLSNMNVGDKCTALSAAGCPVDTFCDIAGTGVCTAFTATVAVGGACVPSNGNHSQNCAAGATCEFSSTNFNYSCVALPAAGAACTSQCYGAASCIKGTCVTWNTVAVGGACVEDNDCTAGNNCDAEVCTAATSSSKATCDITKQTGCTAPEECSCDGSSQVCLAEPALSSSQAQTFIDLANCESKNCPEVNQDCSACNSQLCSAYNLVKGTGAPGCVANLVYRCSSGATLVASVLLMAIAAVFAL